MSKLKNIGTKLSREQMKTLKGGGGPGGPGLPGNCINATCLVNGHRGPCPCAAFPNAIPDGTGNCIC